VGTNVTKIRHTELRTCEKPGPEQQLVDIMG